MQRLLLALALLAPSAHAFADYQGGGGDGVICGDFTIPPEKPAGDNGIRRGGYLTNPPPLDRGDLVGPPQDQRRQGYRDGRARDERRRPRDRQGADPPGLLSLGARADARPPMDTPFPFPTMKPTTDHDPLRVTPSPI